MPIWPVLGRRRRCDHWRTLFASTSGTKSRKCLFRAGHFCESGSQGPLTGYAYLEALAKCRRLTRTEGIDAVMDKFKLDALVAPTMGPACLTDLVVGDRWLGGTSTVAAVAGYPHITVPAGQVFG